LVCIEEVLVYDLPSSAGYGFGDKGDEEKSLEDSREDEEDDDFDIPESKLEKIRILLRGQEAQELTIPKDKHKRKFC